MAGIDDDTEEPHDDAIGDNNVPAQSKGRRQSFRKLARDLTEDDLASPGVQKMMLDELYRLDGVETELKSMSEKFHRTNTSLSVVNEKLKTHNAFDFLSTGGVAVGSALFGAAFSMRESNQAFFWILVALGLLLVLVGALAKVMRS